MRAVFRFFLYLKPLRFGKVPGLVVSDRAKKSNPSEITWGSLQCLFCSSAKEGTMEFPPVIADVASELIATWSCLDNIRLDALPSFGRKLDSSARELALPVALREVETYLSEKRAGELRELAKEAAMLAERTGAQLETFRSLCEIMLMQCQEQSIALVQLEAHLEVQVYDIVVEVAKAKRAEAMGAPAIDALRDYKSMQTNLQRASFQAQLLAFFYSTPITDISWAIWQNVVPPELKSTFFHASPLPSLFS